MSDRDAEKASTTVTRMSKPMGPGSLIIADSYFGSTDAMKELAAEGKYCLFSCNQSRPAYLFKSFLGKSLSKDGDSVTLTGEVPFMETNAEDPETSPTMTSIPFIANGIVSKNRRIWTLANVFSDRVAKQEVEVLVEDNETTDEATYVVETEERPEIRNRYSEMMDYVDRVDQTVASGLAPNRKYHWSQSLMTWELTALLLVNARKMYQSATGDLQMTVPKWKEKIIAVWGGVIDEETKKHPLANLFIGGDGGRCRSCARIVRRKRSTDTTRGCVTCGPICQHCDRVCRKVNCKICDEVNLRCGSSSKTPHEMFFETSTPSRRFPGAYSSQSPREGMPCPSPPLPPIHHPSPSSSSPSSYFSVAESPTPNAENDTISSPPHPTTTPHPNAEIADPVATRKRPRDTVIDVDGEEWISDDDDSDFEDLILGFG